MQGLTIGKLANSAGINLETIRYYERMGLMPEPGRTPGGHRNYDAMHIRRLAFIRRARELGFTLEGIRTLLQLAEPGRSSCGEARQMAAAHLESVRAKLTDLVKMEKLLARTVAECGTNHSPSCPLLEMLDRP